MFMLAFSGLFAGTGTFDLKVGPYFSALNTTGILAGLGVGHDFDEVVGLHFDLDMIYSGKTESKNIGTTTSASGLTQTETLVDLRRKIFLFPLTANLRFTIPIGFIIKPYLGGGFGYNLLIESVSTPVTSQINLYGYIVWRLGLGGKINLGSNSSLSLGAFYNHSKPRLWGSTGLYNYTSVDMRGACIELVLTVKK